MDNVCRTCMKSTVKLTTLTTGSDLINRIETIASIQVVFNAKLPSAVCEECVENINKLYEFRETIINSDIKLQDWLQTLSDDVKISDVEIIKVECESDMEIEESVLFSPETEPMQEPEINTEQNAIYSCKQCSFSSEEKTAYSRHKCSNKDDLMRVCNICGKVLRKYNLNKHVRNHTKEHTCSECGKSFEYYEKLRSHLYEHKGVGLPCSICGKIFYYHGDLNQHEKKHLRKTVEKKIPCPVCSRPMDRRTLKKHIRKHTGERPYPCEYCKKGFSSAYALKTHVRQHTNEKPYACEICPAAFHQKVSLVTHMKSKHSKKDSSNKK